MTNSWRNPPSNPTQEQLAGVNELLQSIGQAPVTTLDTSNPDVAIAWNTLVSTSREVQAQGWTFNKEYNVKLIADASKKVGVPANVLQADLVRDYSQMHHDGVIRTDSNGNQYLYDRENHTSQWQFNPCVDVTYMFNWEEIPVPIQTYIIARAAAICSSRIVGDSGQYSMLRKREEETRVTALEYETSQGDYNYLNLNPVTQAYKTYEPFQALSRY